MTATGQGVIGNNMFAYCGNNPVSIKDGTGYIWQAIVGAAIGGAVAGALISTVSYLSTSGENRTFSGVLASIRTGALSGAIGGVAGALGGWCAAIGSVVVGLCNGDVTARNTEGPLEKKLLAGATTAVITGVGTYLGTKIYTPTDTALNGAVSAYAGGLAVGAPTEIINATANRGINNIPNSQNAGSIYDVRKHLRAERTLG
jgi:hypothetical protein